MNTDYVQGGALSTIEPDQAIRQIPLDTVEHARRFAAACATFTDLQTRSPLLEQKPEDLYRRVGQRLSGAELAVYGVVRQARRLCFPGARASQAELGQLIGRHESTVRRAVAVLLELQLLRVVPQYRDGGVATLVGYDRSQTRNAYALGAAAKEPRVLPGLGGAPPPRRSPQLPDKTPRKVASLSEGRSEDIKSSDTPSCLPSSATTRPDPRGEVSTASTSDRPLPRPATPAVAGAEGSGGRQSKIRTGGLATIGEQLAAKAAQNARHDAPAPSPAAGVGGRPAAAERDLAGLGPELAGALDRSDELDPDLVELIARQARSLPTPASRREGSS